MSGNKHLIRTTVYIAASALIIALLIFFTVRLYMKNRESEVSEHIVIAVPRSEWVQDYGTNYYTRWLSEKTGYDIAFVTLEEGYERESINNMLRAKTGSVDAVFLPLNQEIISTDTYGEYIKNGLLAAPQDYLDKDSCLNAVRNEYAETDFERLLGGDGKMYCFPSVNMSRTARNTQILWINMDWLTRLELKVPRTTDEFYGVLKAFAERDPNGNQKADELPLISCDAKTDFQSFFSLLNSFARYDSENLALYVKDRKIVSDVDSAAFRGGVAYCAKLYRDGFLTGDCFSYTQKQLMELVNDPADTVGAFSSRGIADVIYTNNPGVLAHFVQLAPLSSEYAPKGFSVSRSVTPEIGGFIPQNAPHKEAAARIMDAMLSKEASIIALYGEEGVDWRFSRDGELSTYGNRAGITTIRYFKGELQNRNYAGCGPLFAAAEYTDGVTWNGDHSMTEYIDARAVKTYEDYYCPVTDDEKKLLDDYIRELGQERAAAVFDWLDSEIRLFITGELDVDDDAEWTEFTEEYRRLAKL